MPKVKIEHSKDYTVLSNEMFKDQNLSLKARGLLATMLSLPESWDFTTHGLVSILKDGESSIRTALKELEDYKYLVRHRVRKNDGTFGDIEYILHEKPVDEKPHVGNPVVENPHVDNRTQLNTNELNTKRESKKEYKKESEQNSYDLIVDYLNEKTGFSYRSTTKKTRSLINARLKEKFTVEDFFTVIDSKVSDWLNDVKMRNYLRPETLFGSKFESYLQSASKKKPKEKPLVYQKPEEHDEPEMTDEEWLAMMDEMYGGDDNG